MTDKEGGFYSAEDADSEGEEGKFYVWNMDEFIEILGQEAGETLSGIYGFRASGNFHDEASGLLVGTHTDRPQFVAVVVVPVHGAISESQPGSRDSRDDGH